MGIYLYVPQRSHAMMGLQPVCPGILTLHPSQHLHALRARSGVLVPARAHSADPRSAHSYSRSSPSTNAPIRRASTPVCPLYTYLPVALSASVWRGAFWRDEFSVGVSEMQTWFPLSRSFARTPSGAYSVYLACVASCVPPALRELSHTVAYGQSLHAPVFVFRPLSLILSSSTRALLHPSATRPMLPAAFGPAPQPLLIFWA
ncbi:hypothetical protein LXA43DRAFT_1059919 [Ganoderma leucocontextum]|nr:hypothetical protein LXA43DRAFT_1059919 [Ganoderma leucocontextum]